MLADRGYCSEDLRNALRARTITPRISQRRFTKDAPLEPGQKARPGSGRKKHHIRTNDPDARNRWVVERTNAWLLAFRRLAIRREPNSQIWHSYLILGVLVILARSL